MKVIDRKLREAMEKVQADWRRSKPVGGETAPQEALRTLFDTEAKIQALNQRMEKLDTAKAALGLPAGGMMEAGGMDPRIVEEEVSNLKHVWSELSSLHDAVADLKNTPWSAVQPRKIRESLEVLLSQVKQIPVRYRQYEAFDRLQEDLKTYLAHNHLITELKSETLKDRHWKKILEILNIRKSLPDLSLGDVYGKDDSAPDSCLLILFSPHQHRLETETTGRVSERCADTGTGRIGSIGILEFRQRDLGRSGIPVHSDQIKGQIDLWRR